MRRVPSFLAGSALLLSACGGGGGGTPAEQLSSALDALRGTSFSYEITLDVDNDVLAAAAQDNPDLGSASLFAGSFKMSGAYDGGASQFEVGVMGTNAFEMRTFDDASKVYVQLGLMDLLAGFGMDPADLMAEAQAQGGVPEGAEEFVNAMFTGQWVGFEYDEDALESLVDDDYRAQFGDPAELQQAFSALADRFADPAKLVEDFATVTEGDEVDGVRTFDVTINLRSALGALAQDFRAGLENAGDLPAFQDMGADLQDFDQMLDEGLAEVPETLPGLSVGIRDGFLDNITFDLGVAAAAMGEDQVAPGSALIVVQVDRDDVPTISEPDTDLFYTTDELVQLLESAA